MPDTILNFDNINFSAQIGDVVYFSSGGVNVGGFNNTALENTKKLGPIKSIEKNAISGGFDVKVTYSGNIQLPVDGDYISFAKDKSVNTSSLLGYYASVKFINDSTDKIELFSIGSEVSESSK